MKPKQNHWLCGQYPAAIFIGLVMIAGAIAWGLMILHRHYDYDEVLRAHTIWMTSQGLHPYHDFFEAHPPYFALLAPLARAITDPGDLLLVLRLVAVVGNLLFLAGLATLAAKIGKQGWPVAILGTALVAFHPAVIEFLAEFRIDGWGYALAVWSIVWLLSSSRAWRYAGFGVGTGIAVLFFCPKFVLLPPMILVLEQIKTIKTRASWRDALWACGTFAIGIGVAGGLFWVWLAANGIDLTLLFACLVKYNALSNAHSGLGHGLLREIIKRWSLSVPVLAALVVWAVHWIRARAFPPAYTAALALWLLAQAVLVSYIWKQYYAPWFLFASGFFPLLYALVTERFPKRVQTAVFPGLCVLSIVVSGTLISTWAGSGEAQDEENVLRALNRISNPGDTIVAQLPLHPIYRRDVFYDMINTYDPSGLQTEEILDGIPELRDLVSEQHYNEELETHPPAFVVLMSFYSRRQLAVLDRFMKEKGYVRAAVGNLPVALRPDLYKTLLLNHSAGINTPQ